MKKSEIREIFEKFIESFPDDETEEKTEEKTEEVKEEITEEKTEESTEVLTVEKTETVRKIDESGNMVTERKEIFVDETTGDYIYR